MSLVEFELEGAIAILRLNRPPVNAISDALAAALGEAVDKASDPSVRAVVLTGEPHFAVGADINEFQAAYEAEGDETLAHRLSVVIRQLEQLPKPVIAAVRGFALGGGLEVAMGCDFRYLAEDARVGQAEILLGIIPGAGGTQRLPRLVGLQKAKELNYSGRQVPADEALEIGLADRVVAGDELMGVALTDARQWAEGPTVALGAAKRAMIDGWGRPIDDALAQESSAFQECFFTEDAREGVAAFLGKRPAEFKGR